MSTHYSTLAWRIPGTGEPGGLLSMGLHRVGHDWSDLAAAAAWNLERCNDDPVCETAKETQMYRTDFWTLWERARVGWFERIALKHVYIIICEIDRQSRFNAWDRVLKAGALGWPWGMGWGGRWEVGSGWGKHVHPWLTHVNVWQKPPQYCKVIQFNSVTQSCLTLWPHEPQHTRPPCSSPTSGVHPNPCPLSRWYHPTISSSVVPFSSCPQSLPASGSFQMSQLFASGGQSIGV